MNSLSWMIYLAEVFGNLGSLSGTLLFLVCTFGTCGMAGWAFVYLCEDKPKGFDRPWYGTYATVLIVLSLLVVLSPSRDTLYLIAASEVGQAAATSEYGQELLNKLNAALDAQLEQLTPKNDVEASQ